MFFSLPVFQTNKQQQHWNVLSGDGSSTGEMLQAARLRRRQPAQQHRGLQTLHQSADSTCWRSGCRAQSSSFKHICKSGLCVCVCGAPSHYCHFRQKQLKRWPPGDQIQSGERGAAGNQHEVSTRSQCLFPSSQKAIKRLLINNRGKLKRTPSSIFTLFQYRK